ncbi:hypothetical protein LCGC14_2348640 [marine sediment metagenome]|uniref:Uncharacterized protein n=1 Tax=marine sediment metagenome TaxID=412755 RepID=A0A0F9CX98_9ZZZZ
MKKLILTSLFLLFTSSVFGAGGDIDQAEVIPDVAKWKLDTVTFLVFTKTCKVVYRKVDSNNVSVGKTRQILFQDIVDNPETPQDETNTEFTDLVQAINAGSNIKQTITNAVKIKLGIP